MQAHKRARFKLPRKRWVLLVAAVAMLAVAVPVAWATFSDVPSTDPFYNDVNAIQGAGITSGCGGGNFCPSANITREAEAAFVHRAGVRVGYDAESQGEPTLSNGSVTDLSILPVTVGGVSGQTQFVKLDASVSTYLFSNATGCPCVTQYWISEDGVGVVSLFHYNENDGVSSGAGFGIQTGAVTAVVPVATGTTATFRVQAIRDDTGNTIHGYSSLTAATAPFGSTGGNTLAKTTSSKTGRSLGLGR